MIKDFHISPYNLPALIDKLYKLDLTRNKYVCNVLEIQSMRSKLQNDITHVWYKQLAHDLPEYKTLGWKAYCKLHFGVPILRAEDSQFREFYDKAIKRLDYEQKIGAMHYVPVTSIMTTKQLSQYVEAMQNHFLERGVVLEFINQN